MPKPFKTLLIKLAEKAGLPQENAGLLELLSKIDSQLEDTAFDSLDKFLNDAMTLEIAKKHPTVKAHYDSTIFNGMDAKVKALATEYGLDATEIATIDAEKNSYEKYKLLSQFSKAKIEKEFEGLKAGDKGKLADEIKKLNSDILAIKESSAKEIQTAKEQANNDTLQYAFDSVLGSKKYANEDIPAEVNIMTAKNLLNTELAKRGAKLTRNAEGKLTLVNATNPELEFIENNKVVNFNEFADSTLATNKLLKVSDANPAQPAPRKTIQQDGNIKTPDNSNVLAAIEAQLKQPGMQVS